MALLEISNLRKSFVTSDGANHEVVNVHCFQLDHKNEATLSPAHVPRLRPASCTRPVPSGFRHGPRFLILLVALSAADFRPTLASAGPIARGAPIDASSSQTNSSPPSTEQPQNRTPTALLSTNSFPATNAPSVGGYLPIGFDKLSAFPAEVTYEIVNSNTPAFYYAPKLNAQIPPEIQSIDAKKVMLKGFMLPLQQAPSGLVTEFILLRNQSMCCYGKPPNINEWVHVQMGNNGVKCIMDQVVTVYGRLHVGEYKENRQLLGIYRLDGEKLDEMERF